MKDPKHTLSSWMKGEGPEGDIVLGTRVRLARNLRSIPFPAAANRDQRREVLHRAENALPALTDFGNFDFMKMAEVELLERKMLVEEHLISPGHASNPDAKGVILERNEAISIMINEEDHFRIQVLHPGLQLVKTWQVADAVDDRFEENVEYAFDPDRGFLTACPTNVGTAMRASVMFHVPALALVNQIKQVLGTVSKFGLVVRGLYGEGSDAWGGIYQLSNQVTLGHKEDGIIEHLTRFTNRILQGERQAREYLIHADRKLATEDRLWRSYGILTNARTITTQEAMEVMSDVKLGVELGIIKDVDSNLLKQLIVMIRSAHLQKIMGQELAPEARDQLRASLIRDMLQRNKGK